jgi:hypothetical protein
MSYNVLTTGNFEREAKRLIKKYASLKNEIADLIQDLQLNPTQGTALGNNIYKIRVAAASKGKGKRGGVRVMSCVKIIDEKVFLFSIFSKGEKDDISPQEIKSLIQDIL